MIREANPPIMNIRSHGEFDTEHPRNATTPNERSTARVEAFCLLLNLFVCSSYHPISIAGWSICLKQYASNIDIGVEVNRYVTDKDLRKRA
jgi:hypothetical protein